MSKLKYLITAKKLKIDYFIFEKMSFSLFIVPRCFALTQFSRDLRSPCNSPTSNVQAVVIPM